MTVTELRQQLILSLADVYQLKAFSSLQDLLQGEALILQYLTFHRGEAVYPSDLSRELRLSRSRITGALNSLRGKELVDMHHSEEDRRRVRVSVTPAGMALIGEKLSRMDAYFDQMIDGLGREDTQELIRLIRRCVEVMQA